MPTPFNAEEFRQQMSRQTPQQHGQMPVTQPPPVPARYVPQTGTPQMAAPQAYPSPQAPAPQQVATAYQPPQQMTPQPASTLSQTHNPHPQMAQPWVQHPAQQAAPQAYQPRPSQPSHNTQMQPPAQMFMPPPSHEPEVEDTAPKKPSRFKLKRARKEKPAKELKVKAVKEPTVKADKSEASDKTKTSPPIIFMFGMATGILCFLVGNMAMSVLLSDSSSQSFSEIERRNNTAQQPVLPGEPPTQTAEVNRGE